MFRLPIAGLLGVIVAAGLFYLLSTLVGAPPEFKPSILVARLPSVRVDSQTVIDRPRPIVKPEQTDRPSVPGLPAIDLQGPSEITTIMGMPKVGPGSRIVIGGMGPRFGGGGSDGDASPIVRVLPVYPPHLQGRNIEGWVRVRFNVAADGSVRDARVVASQPEKDFDSAALAAVARWRYRPRIEGGTAVERVGLETILRFELED